MTRQLVVALAVVLLGAQADYAPATLVGASAPAQPPDAVGGGEVLAELTVGADGAVTEVSLIRSTPPFTELVLGAARDWTFSPAEAPDDDGRLVQIESKVLAVALFLPPTLYGGPARGEVPEEVGVASPEVPYISAIGRPAYPAGALFEGVVVLSLDLDAEGHVVGTGVVQSAGVFDEYALQAVLDWQFRPATRNGLPAPATVVAIIGFRQPITPE